MSRTARVSRAINPVSTARELFSIVREMSFDDLKDSALRQPRIAVVARTVDDARQTALDVFGPEASRVIAAQDASEGWPDAADVILLNRNAQSRRGGGGDARVVEFSPDHSVERIRQALVRVGDDLELALGRSFPLLRQPAAMHVISTTARVNGQFALASNLPALIPVVGGVLAAGADTIVLTKNQLMMIYKLAAIHDRDLDNRFRIYQEMLPVVGAGMFWRTVARDLAAMIPFAAGSVPKVAIAFAGTFAAGMAANVYYVEGKRVSRGRMRDFYNRALRELRDRPDLLGAIPVPGVLKRNGRSNQTIIDVDYRSDASPEMP